MVEHFAHGIWTPILACVVSMLGAFLGLRCATRARRLSGRSRGGWIAMGAISIGGVSVWAMHFIAMLGFQVHGTYIRYDLALTLVSVLIPIVLVAAALWVVVSGGKRWGLPIAGLIVGAGFLSMHYLGMASMNMHAGMEHNPLYVVMAAVIALTASVAALWFLGNLWTVKASLGAAVIMGLAVAAMHYTAMMGVRIEGHRGATGELGGIPAVDFITPLILGPGVFLAIGFLLLIGTREEKQDQGFGGPVPPTPAAGSTAPSKKRSLFDAG